MRRTLAGIIEDTERSPLPWGYVAVTFLALVVARNLLEGALGPKGAIGFVYFTSPSSLMVLDHFLFFYVSLFLSFSLLLSALARERIGRVMRVMTAAWALVLLPPFLDYLLTSGEGTKIAYVLDLRPVLFRFFAPGARLENVSTGQRVEILGACLLAAAYVRLKTRNWTRAAAAFAGIYAVLALHGVLPSLFARGSLALSRAAAGAESAYFSVFKAGGIVADESRKLALLFLLTSSVLGWLAYRRHAPVKAAALRRGARPLRALHYLGLTSFGAALGWVIFSRYGVGFAGPGDVLGIAGICAATLCAFEASVAVNDIFDEEADRLSGERRPLVEGTLTRRDVTGHAVALAGAALLFALNIKYQTFLFMLLALSVSFAYSAPPLRLKRFPLVSSLTLGLVSLTACLVGFSAYAEERALALFPAPLAWVIVLSFGLGFAAKDLKDVEGDRATGVWTLPVLLGPTGGRVAVAVLVLLGYLSVAVLLPYRVLALPAVAVGLTSAALVFMWKRPRLAELLLAVCLIFTVAVAVVVLSDIEPMLDGAAPTEQVRRASALGFAAGTAEAWSDWASASSGFEEAARVFPEDPDLQLRAGATLFEQERYSDALPYLERAVDLDRSSPVALEYVVRAESRLGHAESAEWLAREAVRECIRPGVFCFVLGEHFMDAGSPESAASAFERALALGRPDVPTRLRLADALSAQGREPEALAQYEAAVAARPSSAEARDALGRFCAETGRLDRAVSELEEATRLEPDEPLYWNNLGAALRLAGRPEAALQAVDEAARLDPRAPEPYYNRGLTLEALGRTEEARRQYLLALELDPASVPARAALSRVNP